MRKIIAMAIAIALLVVAGLVIYIMTKMPKSTEETNVIDSVEEHSEFIFGNEFSKELEVSPKFLGNPSKDFFGEDEILAKNPWDLQEFNGKIIIGCGDYDNNVADHQVPLMYLDTISKEYGNIGFLAEEQISNIKVIDNTLVIPGIDAGCTNGGEMYLYHGSCGLVNRKVCPEDTGHVFDVTVFNGDIFAALGSQKRQIAVSRNGGLSFEKVPTVNENGEEIDVFRVNGFFVFNSQLYGIAENNGNYRFTDHLLVYNEEKSVFELGEFGNGEHGFGKVYQTASMNVGGIPVPRKVEFMGKMFFISAHALYETSDAENYSAIRHQKLTMVTDIMVKGDVLYALATRKVTQSEYVNILYYTSDGDNWSEVMNFRTDCAAYARSFEISNGNVYFALGSNVNDASARNGELYSIAY